MSISNYGETQLLGTLPSTVYVKWHIGDPGEDGTANAAGNTTRAAATLAAASGNSRAMSGTATWTNVSTAETYSHWSIWDASGAAAGNCWWTGALAVSKTVAVGDNASLDTLSMTLD